jgi:excisionase family DNA binding protein
MTDHHAPTGDWVAAATADLPPLCTVPEVSDLLRSSRRTIYRLIDGGHLDAVRARDAGSSAYLIPRTSVDAYLRRLARAA